MESTGWPMHSLIHLLRLSYIVTRVYCWGENGAVGAEMCDACSSLQPKMQHTFSVELFIWLIHEGHREVLNVMTAMLDRHYSMNVALRELDREVRHLSDIITIPPPSPLPPLHLLLVELHHLHIDLRLHPHR